MSESNEVEPEPNLERRPRRRLPASAPAEAGSRYITERPTHQPQRYRNL